MSDFFPPVEGVSIGRPPIFYGRNNEPILLPVHKAFQESRAKRKILVIHRRGRKTSMALEEVFKILLANPGIVGKSLAPQRKQAKENIWMDPDMLFSPNICPPEIIKKRNDTELYVELINGSIYFCDGADDPHCFDDKTEILSEDGWVNFEHLRKGTKVFTFNRETQTGEWQIPTEYITNRYRGQMVSIQSKRLSALVTPNHRFWVKTRKGVWKFKRADELTSNDRLPAAQKWKGEENKNISLDDCAILGFSLADGWAEGCESGRRRTGSYEVSWCKYDEVKGGKTGWKGNVRRRFIEILKRNGFNVFETEKPKGKFSVLSKPLWEKIIKIGSARTKRIPVEYKNLPREKLRKIVEWMCLGDGSEHKGVLSYATCSKQLADDFGELVVKCGWMPTVYFEESKETEIKGRKIKGIGLYRITVHKKNKFSYLAPSAGKAPYITIIPDWEGVVRCVSVPNEVILVRREGKTFWSGNSKRGANVKVLHLTEAGDHKPAVWYQVYEPILIANGGVAVIEGNPRGRNWYHELYTKALTRKGWATFLLSASDSPIFTPDELEDLRMSVPENVFRSEYLCEWIDSSGTVFRNFDACMTSTPAAYPAQVHFGDVTPEQTLKYGTQYVAGLDLAKHQDYTVFSVFCANDHSQVYMDRFNALSWEEIKARLKADMLFFSDIKNGNTLNMVVETNGAGDPIFDALFEFSTSTDVRFSHDIRLEPFITSLKSKERIVNNLSMLFDTERIKILNDHIQKEELGRFTFEKRANGFFYSAPPGEHDDTILAMAFAASRLEFPPPPIKDQPVVQRTRFGLPLDTFNQSLAKHPARNFLLE